MMFLESKKIVHRDLGYRNVLVSRASPLEIKIADFGLSRFVEEKYYSDGVRPIR